MGLASKARGGDRPATSRAAKARKPGGSAPTQIGVARGGGETGTSEASGGSISLPIPSPPGKTGPSPGTTGKGTVLPPSQNPRGET